MTTTVRPAAPGDAAALAALAGATFALACPPGTTAAAIADFIDRNLSERNFDEYLADPERDLLICEVDQVAAGYTMLVHADPSDPDVAASVTARPASELSKCYVLEGFHGAGVGAALIEASVATSRQRGSAVIWLGVNQHNERANRFYGKHGFAVVGTKKFLVGGNWEDDFTRALDLTPRELP